MSIDVLVIDVDLERVFDRQIFSMNHGMIRTLKILYNELQIISSKSCSKCEYYLRFYESFPIHYLQRLHKPL